MNLSQAVSTLNRLAGLYLLAVDLRKRDRIHQQWKMLSLYFLQIESQCEITDINVNDNCHEFLSAGESAGLEHLRRKKNMAVQSGLYEQAALFRDQEKQLMTELLTKKHCLQDAGPFFVFDGNIYRLCV